MNIPGHNANPSMACFLTSSKYIFNPPIRYHSNHHLHKTKCTATTTSLQNNRDNNTNYISDNARVVDHLPRDANDEWLDKVLIQRSSKANNGEPTSLFETAAFVVEHFLSSNADDDDDDSFSYPLRRVLCEDEDIENHLEPVHWTEQMFSPLFGASDFPPSSVSTHSTAKQMTPKLNRKRQRTNLKITLAYRGLDFCGWEDQRHELYRNDKNRRDGSSVDNNNIQILPSVQGKLVDILDPTLGNKNDESTTSPIGTKHRRKIKTNTKPIEIKVAGRTDAGVSAIAQVCRIRTWKKLEEIEKHVKDLVNEEVVVTQQGGVVGLRIRNVEHVGDDFHPTFGASCRAYTYLINLEDGQETNRHLDDCCEKDEEEKTGPGRIISSRLVPKLDAMLRILEKKELDYIALSYGKVKSQTTLCTLYHARAEIVECIGNDGGSTPAGQKKRAICIELVGDRFLRRMVRILVATALREASKEDACHDAILNILLSKDRKSSARAAPPDGLVFVGAAY